MQGKNEPRTCVTFRSSAFNTTESKDEYINPENYGDDLAKWVMRELQIRGVEVDAELGQEDYGWYFGFRSGGSKYHFIVGWRDDDWVGWVERDAGFLPSLFGARTKDIQTDAPQIIHSVLSESTLIDNLRWHFSKDFQSGDEEKSAKAPTEI